MDMPAATSERKSARPSKKTPASYSTAVERSTSLPQSHTAKSANRAGRRSRAKREGEGAGRQDFIERDYHKVCGASRRILCDNECLLVPAKRVRRRPLGAWALSCGSIPGAQGRTNGRTW